MAQKYQIERTKKAFPQKGFLFSIKGLPYFK